MNALEVFVPYLPDKLISSNTWSDNRQKALGVHAEKEQITVNTIIAFRAALGPELPHFDRVSICITYRHTNKNARDGIYRPTDPSNIGGAIQKAVIDALTPETYHKDGRIKQLGLGLIDDDADPAFIRQGAVVATAQALERVDEIADEGILVTIQPLVAS